MSSIAPLSPNEQVDKPVKRRRQPNYLFVSLVFLLGVVVGMGGLVLFLLFMPDAGVTVSPPNKPVNSAIIVQVSPSYIAQATERNMVSAGLPGTVKNVQVT